MLSDQRKEVHLYKESEEIDCQTHYVLHHRPHHSTLTAFALTAHDPEHPHRYAPVRTEPPQKVPQKRMVAEEADTLHGGSWYPTEPTVRHFLGHSGPLASTSG